MTLYIIKVLYEKKDRLLFCLRVHVLAGTVDASDADALAKAEETYIANLKYAGDKCAEVSGTHG